MIVEQKLYFMNKDIHAIPQTNYVYFGKDNIKVSIDVHHHFPSLCPPFTYPIPKVFWLVSASVVLIVL